MALALLACDRSQRDFQEARTRNTVEAYTDFLDRHPHADPSLLGEAKSLRDARRWDRAAAAHTEAAYAALRDSVGATSPLGRRAEVARLGIETWGRATALDTVPAYRACILASPGGPEARKSEQAIARLIEQRQPRLRAARFLRLTLDLSGGAKPTKDMAALDLGARLRALWARTLEYAGISLVDSGGNGEIAISGRGGPLGASYSEHGLPWDTTWRESGADFSGTIELRIEGEPPLRRQFGARIKPAEVFSNWAVPYDQAAGLPVRNGSVLDSYLVPAEQSLVAQWLLLLRELGGPSVSRAALADGDGEHWLSALLFVDRWKEDGSADALLASSAVLGYASDRLLKALGDLRGPRAVEWLIAELDRGRSEFATPLGRIGDARAVEPLLKALERVESMKLDNDPRAAAISQALTMISGQRLGKRAAPWRAWLDRGGRALETKGAAK